MPEKEKDEKDIGDYFAPANTAVILINIVVFLFVDLSFSSENVEWLIKCGAMYAPYVVGRGEYFRLLTCMFLHAGIYHLAGNMLVLWFIGGTLEQAVGKGRYLFLYFASGILAGIASLGYNRLIGEMPVSVGASGAIFGVVGALLYIICVNYGKRGGFSPRQMALFAALSLYSGLSNESVGNEAHFAGFLSGLLLAFLLCWGQKYREERGRRRYDES